MVRILGRTGLLVGALCVGTGCAASNADLTKRLDAMQKEIKELRATNIALADRVEGMEEQVEDTHAIQERREAASKERPALKVVRLTPQALPTVKLTPATQADDGPRPVLTADKKGARIVESDPHAKAKAPKRGTRRRGTKGGKR